MKDLDNFIKTAVKTQLAEKYDFDLSKKEMWVLNLCFIASSVFGHVFAFAKVFSVVELHANYVNTFYCLVAVSITLSLSLLLMKNRIYINITMTIVLAIISASLITMAASIKPYLLEIRAAEEEFSTLQVSSSISSDIVLQIAKNLISSITDASDDYNTLGYSSMLYLFFSYLAYKEFSVVFTLFFALVSYSHMFYILFGIARTTDIISYAAMHGGLLATVIGIKYYQTALMSVIAKTHDDLAKTKTFYTKWLENLNISYFVALKGNIQYSNKYFDVIRNEFKGQFVEEAKINSSNMDTVKSKESLLSLLCSEELNDVKDFTEIGVLEIENRFFECRLNAYDSGYREIFLTEITQIIELKHKEIEEKFKGNVFAKIAHEFKTPMGNIGVICDKLAEKPGATRLDSVKQDISMMRGLTDYIVFLVNDITAYTKGIKAMEFTNTTMDLNDSIQFCFNVLKSLVEVRNSSKRSVKPILENELKSRPISVKTDHIRLKQILLNLISNAVKFTMNGSITLKIAKEQDKIAISLRDTGRGISPCLLSQIQTDEIKMKIREEYNQMGSGLGLSICRQICRQMDLDFTLTSEENRWTKAKILLDNPQNESFSSENSTETVEYKGGFASLRDIEVPLQKSKTVSIHTLSPVEFKEVVIVAEDNTLARKSMKRAIEKISDKFNKDWLVIEVEDGAFTISEVINNCLKGRRIKFLITDEFMDFLNGSECVSILRTLMEKKKIEQFLCISCSAFGDEGYYEKMKECGVESCLEKPVNVNNIIETLRGQNLL